MTTVGMDIQVVDFQTREACMQTLRAFNSPETCEGEQIDFDMPIKRGWCVDDAPFEGDGERNLQRVWK